MQEIRKYKLHLNRSHLRLFLLVPVIISLFMPVGEIEPGWIGNGWELALVMVPWTCGISLIPFAGLFICWILAIWKQKPSPTLSSPQAEANTGILRERRTRVPMYGVFGKDYELVFLYYRLFLLFWIIIPLDFLFEESVNSNMQYFWGPFIFWISILLAFFLEIAVFFHDHRLIQKSRPDGQEMSHTRTLNNMVNDEKDGMITKDMEIISDHRVQSVTKTKSPLVEADETQGEKVFSPGAVVTSPKQSIVRSITIPVQSSAATASFIAGILAVLFGLATVGATLLTFGLGSVLFFLPLIPSVLAVIIAYTAKKQLHKIGYQGEYLKRATYGLIMGLIGLCISMLIMCVGCAFWGYAILDSV